ncbi:unnamed protein product, partial [Symbiodinium sp. KB8]
MQRRRLDDSAIIIQRRARIVLARKKAAKRRQIAYRLRLEEAARMVQKSWRGKKARDLARTAREALLEYRRKAEAAAIMVQRHWRGLAGRRWMLAYRKWLAEAGERQRQAALQIQRIVRGKLGKLRVKRIRARNEWIKKNQWKAAMVVQAIRAEQRLRHDAAVWIQSRWRARKGRLAGHVLKQARQLRIEYDAAVKIQGLLRKKKATLLRVMLQAQREERKRKAEYAALSLQRLFRASRARRLVRRLMAQRDQEATRREDFLNWAATLVQKIWRRAYALKIEKMKRWKEIWDPVANRPFFYDQTTGEDYALFECRDCEEFFCEACWGPVHSGGKRRQHVFRPIYDAYGKRIDYGEGEWPAVWPSEIEQDEFLGWGLLSKAVKAEEARMAEGVDTSIQWSHAEAGTGVIDHSGLYAEDSQYSHSHRSAFASPHSSSGRGRLDLSGLESPPANAGEWSKFTESTGRTLYLR